jgi:hypothetical protein
MALVQAPLSIIESLILSSIIYFLVGFTTGALLPIPGLTLAAACTGSV